MYGTHDFVLDCDTKTVEINNQAITLPVHWANSEFNEIKLTSNKSTNTASISSTAPVDCSATLVTAEIISNQVISSVQWLNDSLSIVGTGYTFETADTGDFTCRVNLDTGCVIDTPFTIT
jgi:hypothetical protein